jgi:hypothetical protein
MHPFFVDFLDRVYVLHQGVEKELDALPPQALDWVPGPEMNSATVLVVHLAGSERYWIGEVLAGEPSGRVREAEFETHGLEAADLRERLAASRNYIQGVLERLPLEALGEERISARDGRRFGAAWCLLHALEHTAIHLGHLQIVRQLWDQKRD